MKPLILLFAAASALCAADISGKWSGTSEYVNRDGQTRSLPVNLTLQQKGEQVTGTAGPSAEQQQQIQNGKFDGNQLTFEVSDGEGKAIVSLMLAGEAMKGEAKYHREYGIITIRISLERK
jgi:hypothetical protein